jgi:peptide/nickel transport system substrate-binding protein
VDEQAKLSNDPVRSMSRRLFLRRAAVLSGGTLLLAACAPAPAPAPTQAPSAPKPTQAPGAPKAETKPAEPATAAQSAAGQPKPGGTYTHGSAQEPDRFWAPITGLTVSNEVAHLANSTLIKTDEKLEFVPALAAQVPSLENGGLTADGLTYTFKLRPGVRWSDGTPFTSADVKFTYDVLMMPGVDVRGRVGWDQIGQVDTPDETTVILKFRAVDAGFLDRVAAVQMLPKHVLGGLDAQAINQHQWFRAPNPGLGPFTFKEWVPGSHITLTRNPNYYKSGQPYIDTVIFKVVPDANTLLNQLENGEVDSRWRLNNEHVDIVKDFRTADLVSVASATPWLLWMNHTRAPFNDREVRLALAHGVDKDGIAKQLLKGHVEPAWQLVSPLSWGHNPNVPKHTYDPTRAKQILDAAGWAPGPDGIRAKGNDKLSFELMNIAGEQERVQVLSFVQRQWKEIGVDARIKMVDVGTMWGQGLPKRNYDMAYSYSGRNADPEIGSHYLSPEHQPTNNFAGYANPEVDQVLLASSQTVDRARRKELLFQAQEMVARDEVYLFLNWLTNHTVMNKRIAGYKPAPAYVEFWNVDEWWVKT